MANTIALRRRIKTAQNISKTTRAMQMIAASKLKRAQEAVVASRPYVTRLIAIAQNLAPQKNTSEDVHPYMVDTKISEKTLYIVIGPDKGLCGGLVTNLLREYIKHMNENTSLFITVGKKIESPISSTSKNVIASFSFGSILPTPDKVYPIVELVDEYFLSGKVSAVKILVPHFESVFSQKQIIVDLLPIRINLTENQHTNTTVVKLIEPNKAELLPALLKRYIEMVIFQQMLELFASFQAAQMMAMQNATNNAKDIVSALKLLYNKARQEKITSEILDISSATVAMESR